MNTTGTFTFITRAAPHGSARPQHCLDMALAAAVFEQQVNYVFQDDGIYQLLKGQQAGAINAKPIDKALTALDIYGIKNLYVCADSLSRRNLAADDLIVKAELVTPEVLKGLLAESTHVFTF